MICSCTSRRRMDACGPALAAIAAALSVVTLVAAPQPSAPIDVRHLSLIRPRVEEAIAAGQLPGAVVLVGGGDRVLFEQAIGRRALLPAAEPMTADTIFDLASLTKVVATTPLVMQLVESGRLRLDDPAARYFPEFGRYGKAGISIRELLTHTSGLRGDLDVVLGFHGREEAYALACDEVPVARPGTRVIYSDINFIVLGAIVERVLGEPLERAAAARIFEPLGMIDTGYLPRPSLRPRIAPTERCAVNDSGCIAMAGPGGVLRGVVHDPTARAMGGVAGHAGVFSTARDLSRFCRMLLDGGRLDGVRVLSPLGIAAMTHPSVAGGLPARGLGWDIDSAFASNRGDLFPVGTYGHTGWTGGSLWVDPGSGVYDVILSNRVHPDGRGDVLALRGSIASIVAASVRRVRVPPGTPVLGVDYGARPAAPVPTAQSPTLNGIDVLRAHGFAELRGRRVGLLTNQTGRARDGTPTIDLLHDAPGMSLVALFSPEHGIRGTADALVASSRDARTGLPIYSLYGESKRPTPEMLAGLDTIVVDLQDIGARFYTYAATVGSMLEAAAPRGIRVVVLDRPNPLNGFAIEGPLPEPGAPSAIAYFPLPTRHGLTIGELARLYNGERRIGADLQVIAMEGWSRAEWFDGTGLEWVNPSPNMRSLTAATLYPGLGSIEFANLSVGRGTDAPLEQVGAPWIDGQALASALNARQIPGVRFYPVTFTPASREYAGEACHGVRLIVTDRDAIRPVRVGVEIAAALFRLYPEQFEPGNTWQLLGSRRVLERLKAGEDPAVVAAGWNADEARWRRQRAKYLLYY